MTDQEKSQALEAALQRLIGTLQFQITLLQIENDDLRRQVARHAEPEPLRAFTSEKRP
jgi:hypothetical protein